MNARPTDAAAALKLVAVDGDDLAVISGALQDAIVPIGDMSYRPAAAQFVLAASRFRWESDCGGRRRAGRQRVNAGVTFSNVVGVRRRGIDLRARGDFLNLLSVTCAPASGSGAPDVQLTFSGDRAIRLRTTGLLCHLEDFGEPWPTRWRPRHADR